MTKAANFPKLRHRCSVRSFVRSSVRPFYLHSSSPPRSSLLLTLLSSWLSQKADATANANSSGSEGRERGREGKGRSPRAPSFQSVTPLGYRLLNPPITCRKTTKALLKNPLNSLLICLSARAIARCMYSIYRTNNIAPLDPTPTAQIALKCCRRGRRVASDSRAWMTYITSHLSRTPF